MNIDKTRSGVIRGMAAAVAVAMGVSTLAYIVQWPPVSIPATTSLRLEWAAGAALAPAAAVAVCIARLAKHRFSTPEDIHGSALTEGSERARLLQALLQNTLEQAVLAIPVYVAAALAFPARCLPLLAACAALFVVGRVLFFRGYGGGAPSRAMGFGLTFYPSVVMLVAVIALGVLRAAA